MLNLPEGVRIWVATAPCDMRKQADGLSALVEGCLMQQPKLGHLFVFFSRRKDFVRILFWDANGYCTVSKTPCTDAAHALARSGSGPPCPLWTSPPPNKAPIPPTRRPNPQPIEIPELFLWM